MSWNAAAVRLGPGQDPSAVRRTTIRVSASVLGVGAVLFTVIQLPPEPAAGTAIRVAGTAVPVVVGVATLGRRLSDRFSLLLIGAGTLWAVTTLAESPESLPYSIGRVAVWLIEPLVVYLLVAYPNGRIESPEQLRLVQLAMVLTAVLWVPTALLAPFPTPTPWASCEGACPGNAFLLGGGAAGFVETVVQPLREILAVVVWAAVGYAVGRRARRAGPLGRLLMMPVLGVALVRLVAMAGYFAYRQNGHVPELGRTLGDLYALTLPALTLAFAGGALTYRVLVGDVLARLARTLRSEPSIRELRHSLASALGDPDLEVVVASSQSLTGWRDTAGAAAPEPVPTADRAVAWVEPAHRVAILHDPYLDDPLLLDAMASCVYTAISSRQHVEDLEATLAELSRSRARLVTVADEERRRLERDLHDGAQQRLVALQIKLELLAERLEETSPDDAARLRVLEGDVAATLAEVRALGRGVYTPLLADRGLGDALESIARTAVIPTIVDVRLPHRYPPEVESAVYFACLEAMQNAAKHARDATRIRIVISGDGRLRFDVRDDGAGFDAGTTPVGAGLINIRDRIRAVSGDVEIISEPGRGTRVRGFVPVK